MRGVQPVFPFSVPFRPLSYTHPAPGVSPIFRMNPAQEIPDQRILRWYPKLVPPGVGLSGPFFLSPSCLLTGSHSSSGCGRPEGNLMFGVLAVGLEYRHIQSLVSLHTELTPINKSKGVS